MRPADSRAAAAATAVSATAIGPVAARILARDARGIVGAVFDHSLHLEVAAGVVCLVAVDLGNGPLNLVLADAGWRVLAATGPKRGDVVAVTDAGISIGSVSVGVAGALAWIPPPWPEWGRADRVQAAVMAVSAEVRRQAPAGLLAVNSNPSVAVGRARPGASLAGITATRGATAAAALAQWIGGGGSPSRCPDPPQSVRDAIGLGPGLTPSFDDILVGALIGLAAAGRTARHAGLAAMVRAVAAQRTSALSAAFLQAATEGLAHEHLIATAAAIRAGDVAGAGIAAALAAGIGATSGVEALTGLVIGFSGETVRLRS